MHKTFTRLLFATALLCAVTTVQAQISLPVINAPYGENFNTLALTGTTNDISTLPAGWTFLETGTNANTTYAAGTGSSNAGNTYSFGLDGTDRALGGLQSGSLVPTLGAGFTNNTGVTITALQIVYRGEQWRLGATARGADRLDLQYSLNATALNNGTWTDVNELDFSSPVTSGTVGALNGNDSLNSATLSFTIEGLEINSGETFYIRWQDFNVSSSDDGLAIDDFVLVPVGTASEDPTITLVPSTLNFGDVVLGSTRVLSYRVRCANLTDSILARAFPGASFALSTDGVTFSHEVMLPDTGAVVYMRFTPPADGLVIDSIFHISGPISAQLTASGTGIEPSLHLISIAEARTKPVGTFVSVAGRVTVANEHGNPAFIQDSTGGIPIFHAALANAVSIGDSVLVYGPVGVFNDQKQISGNGIRFTIADTVKRFIAPKPIGITELAANEGLLVTVQDVEMVNKRFVFYPQSTERITSGGVQADLRIDGDTDLPGRTKPQGVVDITGVVGRFRTNAQLLPRFQEDVPGTGLPETPHDTIPRNTSFDVVTWNLEFFGAASEDYGGEEYGPEDEALQLANVKKVIDSLQVDILAVQEISSDTVFAQLVSQLPGYGYRCSDRYSYSFQGPDDEFPPQKVCFIFDTTTVKVLDERVLFEALYDSARTVNPALIPGYPGGNPSSFWSSGRLPYLLTIEATVNGVTEKMHLIDIHAKSGSASDDRQRRAYDAQVLKDTLDAHFAEEKFILIGDYNDDLDVSISSGAVTPYAPFVNDTTNYLAVTRNLSDVGARSTISFQDMIDHQILSNELAEAFLEGSEKVITPFALIHDYPGTTSDHLPVQTRFRFVAPKINFTQATLTVAEDSSATYVVNFTLSKPLNDSTGIYVNVDGSASYGEDFNSDPSSFDGILVIPVGAGAVEGSFSFSIIEDTADETAEQIIFSFPAQSGIQPGLSNTFTVTIEDNDVPAINFAERSVLKEEGSGPYQVRLPLSTAVSTDQTVSVKIWNGLGVSYSNDYVTDPAPVSNVITVPVSAGSTEAAFTVTPLDDNRRELPFEPIIFTMTSASPGLTMGRERLFIFTIRDVRRQAPALSIFPNPTVGKVRLVSDDNEFDGEVRALIRNREGIIIFQGTGTLTTLSESISRVMESARKGLYTVQLSEEGETTLHRVIRN